MALEAKQLWEILIEKFDDNKEFSKKFGKRALWNKIYYNLDTANKDTCIVVDYSKRDNRLELDIYFFERKDDFDKLYAQRDRIKQEEGLELSYEIRTDRTQGIYIKRYDIDPEGDRKYLEGLVEWIQDTALLLCYISEKYLFGKNVTRPGLSIKHDDIHSTMLPAQIIENGGDYDVKCARCGETYRKAKRCTFCGQLLQWPDKDIFSKYLLRKEGNKRQLIDADDWATVTPLTTITRKNALDIIDAFTDLGFTYHVGTSDLVLDLIIDKDLKLSGLMLFGGGEQCGFQPSSFFEFAESIGEERKIVEDFLIKMIPFLSKDQKNKPYDNPKGYYYIDYSTLYASLEDIVGIYDKLLDAFGGTEGWTHKSY